MRDLNAIVRVHRSSSWFLAFGIVWKNGVILIARTNQYVRAIQLKLKIIEASSTSKKHAVLIFFIHWMIVQFLMKPGKNLAENGSHEKLQTNNLIKKETKATMFSTHSEIIRIFRKSSFATWIPLQKNGDLL